LSLTDSLQDLDGYGWIALTHEGETAGCETFINPNRIFGQQLEIATIATACFAGRVTLIKQHQITAAVRFRGGATTTMTLPRPLTAQQLRATHADVRTQIDVLLNDYSDAQVAHILNERGLHTGASEAFDAVAVQWVRSTAKLPSLKQRLITAGAVMRTAGR